MKICLDAGHGAWDNRSPAVERYYEGNRMFEYQRFLKKALEAYGIEALCTRSSVQDDPSLFERGTMAKGCDLFLSLHSNAVGGNANESVDYVRVYYPVSGNGKALAQALSEVIASAMGTRQSPQILVRWNSAKNADYYGVIRYSANVGVTGLILEHSFHTNTRMTNWLLQDDNLRLLAQAEAACIAEYYGLQAEAVRYELLKDVKNPRYRAALDKLGARGLLLGKGGAGEGLILDLGEDALRILALLDRMGLLDTKN